MKEIKVSILVPVYNAESFIQETIDSVLTQTFKDFELLLMDDGSIDSTSEIVKSYNDSRVKYKRCTHNFVDTLNLGLEMAKGKYIALLDHDDIMVPNRLQIQYDFMETHTGIVACGGCMREFGKSGNFLTPVPEYEQIILEILSREKRYICNPTGFIRKEIFDRYNLQYKKGYSFAADIKLWTDILKVGKIVNLQEVLVWYRKSDTQTSQVSLTEIQKIAEVIFQEHAEYLVSKVRDTDMKAKLENKILPVLKKLADLSVFPDRIYFLFLANIIKGLYRNGFLDISEPLGI
jgi:glycosyltransferase involved in cell wall biosynthesis